MMIKNLYGQMKLGGIATAGSLHYWDCTVFLPIVAFPLDGQIAERGYYWNFRNHVRLKGISSI
jgi:hypothetical protein